MNASPERLETTRHINASPGAIFALLADPQGHVDIDSTGMLQDATGEPATAVGDTFVVHMDREALGDYPELGRYDVTVQFTRFEQDRAIEWTILSTMDPPMEHVYGYELTPGSGAGTEVRAYYDWSKSPEVWKAIFPIIDESALRATLGILDRTVRRRRSRPASA